jgi:DNA-binding SARP family transcriptional activator
VSIRQQGERIDERIHVRLLGRVEVGGPDRQVRLAGRQAQALFALLAIDRRRRPREAIAADLWPDSNGASTACLRQALWLVKSGLAGAGLDPEEVLEIEPDLLGLRSEAVVELDAVRFEAAARSRPADAERALRLYGGDLAEGLGHECFATERERLSDLYEDVLALAAEERLARGDLEGAREAAERLLARDPLREEAHAVLIGVFAECGTRSQVARQYRRLRTVLNRELEVEPLPETEAAYRQALVASLDRSRQRLATGDGSIRRLTPSLVANA